MAKKRKKYHYIYKTINLITMRYYYGMHSTYKLDDGYLGSGKRLRYSINKYGEENHVKTILEYFETREELKKRESEIVTWNEIAKENCMNLQPGGGGGWTKEQQSINGLNSKKSQDLLRETNPGWVQHKSKAVTKALKKQYNSDERNRFQWGNWKGRKHKDETKKKIGLKNSQHQSGKNNSQFGTCWIYNTELKVSKKINKDDIDKWLQLGWFQGRKMNFK